MLYTSQPWPSRLRGSDSSQKYATQAWGVIWKLLSESSATTEKATEAGISRKFYENVHSKLISRPRVGSCDGHGISNRRSLQGRTTGSRKQPVRRGKWPRRSTWFQSTGRVPPGRRLQSVSGIVSFMHRDHDSESLAITGISQPHRSHSQESFEKTNYREDNGQRTFSAQPEFIIFSIQ